MTRKTARQMVAYFCPVCGREYMLEPSVDWLCSMCNEILKPMKLPHQVLRRRRNGVKNA